MGNELTNHLADNFCGSSVLGSDFSSMEHHHHDAFAELGLFWIHHVCCVHPDHRFYLRIVARMLLGRNVIRLRNWSYDIPGTLQSGSPWTSSLNSVLNYCILSFLATYAPHLGVRQQVRMALATPAIFEGDDGVIVPLALSGVSTPLIEVTLAKFEKEMNENAVKLGCKLKIISYKGRESIFQASFCGKLKPGKHLDIVTNPVKHICNFFWLTGKWMGATYNQDLGLIRAKALSLLYVYPNHPILSAMCWAITRTTRSKRPIFTSDSYTIALEKEVMNAGKFWQRDSTKLISDVNMQTRLFVEEQFGVGVRDQIELEELFLSNADDISEVQLPYYPWLA